MIHDFQKIKLITFTGASGVGKTKIARTLLDRYPRFAWLESVTTREKRLTNFPDEYVHVSKNEFLRFISREKFVEWVQVHSDDYYGTLKSSLDKVLANPKHVYLKTIDPVGLTKLYAYAPSAILPFYIIAPSQSVLRQRLTDRGENEDTIQRRISDCTQWDSLARHSSLPYEFIENEKTIDDAIATIIERLRGMI